MPMRSAIPLDRIKRALGAWVETARADDDIELRWAGEPYPRAGTRTFVVLNLPTPATRQVDHSDRLVTVPSSIRFELADTFPAGQRFRLFVNRYPHDVIAATANDPDAVIALLIAAVVAGPEPVDATTPAPGRLLVTRIDPGDLTSAALVPAALVPAVDVLTTEDVSESGGARMGTLSVNVHSPRQTGALSADQVAANLIASLAEGAVRRALRNEGVTVWSTTTPRDVSALEGTELERRIQFDVRLGMHSRLTRAGVPIEGIEIARTVGTVSGTITVPEP